MTRFWEKLRSAPERGKAVLERCRPMKKPFAILLGIYLLGISAIVRADFNYIDDMGRAFYGYQGWGNYSRYLSNFLSQFIHGGSYLTDVSPLPQLIAVVILALSGVAALRLLSDSMPMPSGGGFIIAAIPLGLSPYMLECLSYKYDAPYMALSVLAAIAPFLLRRRDRFTYLCAVLAGTAVICLTYQASSGILPMLAVLLAFQMWNRGEPSKDILAFLAVSAAGYLLGLVWFKLTMMQAESIYVDASIAPLSELPGVLLANYRQYFALIRSDLKGGWLLLIVLLCAAFLYTSVRSSRRAPAAALPVSAAALLVMLLLCFGVYPAFQQPLFSPRGMYGFGVFVALVGLSATTSGARFRPAELLCALLGWCFLAFGFTYGNALAAQKAYTDFRIQMVIEDLKSQDILLTGGVKQAQLAGSIGYAPQIRNMPQDYQILNRLVPVTFCENWYWGYFGIDHYYGLRNLDWLYESGEDWSAYGLPVLADTVYHTIRGDQERILIELK